MKSLLILLGLLAPATSYFLKLSCPAELDRGNPFDCAAPNVCNDQECSASQRICCAVSGAGQCGYECSLGQFEGCFETQWICYGSAPAEKPVLPKRRNGDFIYIDNQDGVVNNPGAARRIEYYADRTGVEIEFFLLEFVDTQFRYRKTSYQTSHTATTIGTQAVLINWTVNRAKLRFAFRTSDSGEFPIPWDNDKRDSSNPYHSFLLDNTNSAELVVPASQRTNSGVNIRFMARICINETTDRVDDSFCPYNPLTSSTTGPISYTTSQTTSSTTSRTTSSTTTTSQTTSMTTSQTSPDNNCVAVLIPKEIGCIGQGAPQDPGNVNQVLASGSDTYSMIDLTGAGELRFGIIHSVEYRVVRLLETGEHLWFRVWGPIALGSSEFELIHSVPIFPTEINTRVILGDLRLTVQDTMRLGFSFQSPSPGALVPIRYTVTNVRDQGTDTGNPYVVAECNDPTGCADGVNIGNSRVFMDRQNLERKQFRIRACMLVEVPGTTCASGATTPSMSSTASITTSRTTSRTTASTSATTSGPCTVCPAGPPGPPGPAGPPAANGRKRREVELIEEEAEVSPLEAVDEKDDSLFSLQSTQLLLLVWNSVLTLMLVMLPVYIYQRRQHNSRC